MMKSLFVLILLALCSVLPLRAEEEPRLTVIELFTSQGCSSCPPADALLKTMRDRPGVLTLSWAVDYWDRLGWRDTFGAPYNSMRQTAYNKRLGRGGVFTPQIILDGQVSCVGSKPEQVKNALEKARMLDRMAVSPALTSDNAGLHLALPGTALDDTVAVRVVWYLGDATVEIMSGENNGRTLHYTNIVRGTDILEDWDGSAQTLDIDSTDALASGADHIAILLQRGYGHGPIIGAASLKLTPAT
ncbi:DUF1223 domain-containing protein [Kordiimonas pumila]|uniref:DUF1223 domain-containing protein n=1 Tax=Kordiimonas pumila TaxID=2161677 RepID=A0ABV7D2P7_9PROT|nr:DUF1223 domain-containing protein [Kordiimonas pumila]